MNNNTIRILLADDEATITRIYSVGLPSYFARAVHDATSELAAELFDAPGSERPAADITICRQGDEAVEQFRDAMDAGTPYHIVVLDIRMPPGIDGVEAAKQIRALDRDVKVLFVSGYSDYSMAELQRMLPPPTHMDFMKKPVKLAALAERIVDICGVETA